MGTAPAWHADEDAQLYELVQKYGLKWASISQELQTRGSKQCRRRWMNYLNTECKVGGWEEDEDRILMVQHAIHGNKWTEIAKSIEGRTDNAVKNRYAALQKRKEREGAGGARKVPRARNVRARASSAEMDDEDEYVHRNAYTLRQSPSPVQRRAKPAAADKIPVLNKARSQPPAAPLELIRPNLMCFINLSRVELSDNDYLAVEEVNGHPDCPLKVIMHNDAQASDSQPAAGKHAVSAMLAFFKPGLTPQTLHHDTLYASANGENALSVVSVTPIQQDFWKKVCVAHLAAEHPFLDPVPRALTPAELRQPNDGRGPPREPLPRWELLGDPSGPAPVTFQPRLEQWDAQLLLDALCDDSDDDEDSVADISGMEGLAAADGAGEQSMVTEPVAVALPC